MIAEKFRITDVRLAFLFMALFAIAAGSVSTYIGAMITTIEKRFSYNSMEMGAIMGANDMGYLLTVILVAYFASKKERKSIVLSLSSVGLCISSLIYTLPYFVFGSRFKAESLMFVNKSLDQDLCSHSNRSFLKENIASSTDISQKEKYVSLFIYMVGGILNGVSSTPFWNIGITFLDEMAGPARSGIYIGLLYATRSLAPIFGFLLGSYVLKFHESIQLHVSNYLPGQKDFKWIGAWWLGWMILGFCVLIPAPFLALLKAKPKSIPKRSHSQKVEFIPTDKIINDDLKRKSRLHDLRKLLGILRGSMKNKIYVSLVTGMIFEILSFVCLLTFFTKFLEFHFRVSASLTNSLTAFCLAGSSVTSSVISGSVSHFFKTSVRNMNRYHAIVNTLAAISFPILFIFTCPSATVIGLTDTTRTELCSQKCPCQIRRLQPVCLNATTIFSPCLAGCRTRLNETFYGSCGCGIGNIATKGFCEEMCPNVYGFLVAFFVIRVVGSIAGVQFTQVLLRLTEQKNKAVYLSIISMIYGICGFVFPPLAGLVLDTACTYRDVNRFGMKSHCLIYDNDKIRYLILGVAFALQIPSSILYIMAWIYTPPNYTYEKKASTTSKVQSELTAMS